MAKRRSLVDLLVKLSLDPELRRRFREAPSALEDEPGLSEEDLDLAAGGNPEQGKDDGGFTPA